MVQNARMTDGGRPGLYPIKPLIAPAQQVYGRTGESNFNGPGGGIYTPPAPQVQSVAPFSAPVQTRQVQTGGGGGGGAVGAAPVAAPAVPNQQDFLNSDDIYLAALSRYNKQFDDLSADVTRRQNDYGLTYDNGVKDLGYIAPQQPGGEAGWAFDNQQTAAGRAYQSLIQDFAARGLIHSGDYLRSADDLKTNLGKQFTNMADARSQFDRGLNSERTSGQSSQQAGIAQARAEALARMAAQYGSV